MRLAPSNALLNTVFQDFLLEFMKCFLDDFNVYTDILSHLSKLRRCIENVQGVWHRH